MCRLLVCGSLADHWLSAAPNRLDVAMRDHYKARMVPCRNGYGVVCKTIEVGSIPTGTSSYFD